MVFFIGTLSFGAGEAKEGALLDLATGKLSFAIPQAQASVIRQTLAAVLFIQEQIEKKGTRSQPWARSKAVYRELGERKIP